LIVGLEEEKHLPRHHMFHVIPPRNALERGAYRSFGSRESKSVFLF
jgi:hypothetical protein